ncbi:glutamate--tRNA ligase [Falsiroseomonas selenitidurans]|uniref:Glutamate--tRNA ligase n=1 Tax=Falsiroseomonas selenitidurans TaxID=2716335 RepID=A0ABX1E3P7_9PROT|nr:glutamate--tRNA ligase [Falsiroseomonas selenitidurans]NKC29560.1 glutamate--tRNA ligase [Falsiroseomonas selenitidurans]
MKLRFAPSPTGLLHVGNARIAIANWCLARHRGGRFLLRLDDTDTERSRPDFAQAIEEDLRWLGLDWDDFARQSDRLASYAAAAERLKASGHLYPCLETEEELAFKREQRIRQGKPPLYDRAALRMTAEQLGRALANGKVPHWRFKLSGGQAEWQDGVLGRRGVKLSSLSDPVLIRADGSFLYTFTSVVDDLEMGITDIVRGEDHVTNTGIQLDIFTALGGAAARLRFAHIPLLTDADGGPLSKRTGSVGLRQLRRDGVEPAALVGYLAALGTSADPVPAMPADLVAGFDLSRVSRSAARFDTKQLLALNRRWLHGLAFDAVRDRLPDGAGEDFWLAVRGNLDLLREARDWWEIATGDIEPPAEAGDAELLRQALESLPEEPWDEATWPAWTSALSAGTGRKGRALYLPLRRALTGEDHGPDLRVFLPFIGRDRAQRRLARAAG